jgi:hypothetical protein
MGMELARIDDPLPWANTQPLSKLWPQNSATEGGAETALTNVFSPDIRFLRDLHQLKSTNFFRSSSQIAK